MYSGTIELIDKIKVSYEDKKCIFFAEILVTLMIIGVIAAMTIPALRKDSMNKTITTNLKKIYSEMNQATSLALTNNNTNRMYRTGLLDSAEIFETEFVKKYFNLAKECEADDYTCFGGSDWINKRGIGTKSYVLANGISIKFDSVQNQKDLDMYIYVDVNGPKSPNKGGTDQLIMQMNGLGTVYVDKA